jgi:DNA-binding GntR family transcriptional regulator
LAVIWTQPAARNHPNPASIDRAVSIEAPRLLAKEELRRCAKEEQLWYYLPETGQQLIDAILDGDGQRFVDSMTAHFDLLARFTPLLDKLLIKPTRAK